MRHLKAGRKFGRNPAHRRAMLRNLTANLITHERIQTTDAKAKELRRVAERLITKAVRLGDIAYQKPGENPDRNRVARRLHVVRQIRSYIPRFGLIVNEDGLTEKIDLVEKVLIDLAKRFQGRPGGYTRIIKIGPRRGDNAPMSIIEFVSDSDDSDTVKAEDKAEVEEKAEDKAEDKAEVEDKAEDKAEDKTEVEEKAEEKAEAEEKVEDKAEEKAE